MTLSERLDALCRSFGMAYEDEATMREAADLARRWEGAEVVTITDCNNPIRRLPDSPFDVSWTDFPTIQGRIVPEAAGVQNSPPDNGETST